MGYLLAVEDDPVMRRALRRAVDGLVEVRFAETGEAAMVALAGNDLPDFVLLDFLLPDLTGLAVLQQLRQKSRWASIPVVIFSSLQDPIRKAQTLAAGADDWVTKPDDPHDLRTTVAQLCKIWGSQPTEAVLAR